MTFEQLARDRAFREIGPRRRRLARAMKNERAKEQPNSASLERATHVLAQYDQCLVEWLESWKPEANHS